MDFITKKSDLEETERLYGKQSDQYKLHKQLIDAANKLRTTGSLSLGKMCKQEYININFHTNIFDYGRVNVQTKIYWDVNKTQFRKKKEKPMDKTVSDLIYDDVFHLITDGKYEVI